MDKLYSFIGLLMQHLSTIVLIILSSWIFVLYLHDRFQHKSTILRNYPVIGRARFWLEDMGQFKCHLNTCPTGITSYDRRYHKGQVPEDKAVRVMNYANQVHKGVEGISHTCGAAGALALSRKNALIFVGNQQAENMEKMYQS